MRIFAPEILIAVGLLSIPAVGAEAVRGDNAPLPQFMPPAARAQVENAETKPATEETRRAAEALSSKFSDDVAASHDDTDPDPDKSKTTASAAIEPPSNLPTPAHVAVLRARASSTDKASKKTKSAQVKAAPTSDTSKPRKTKVNAGRSREPHRAPIESYRKTDGMASNAVPGAKAGWQTGLIGMLTNPAFWH